MASRFHSQKPSWSRLTEVRSDEDANNLRARAEKAVIEIRPELKQAIEDYLMLAWVMRVLPAGASDSALRDHAAGQRVAMHFVKLLQAEPDDHGNRDTRRPDGDG